MRAWRKISRRRFFRIAGTGGALTLGVGLTRRLTRASEPELWEWSGILFGSAASIQFYASSEKKAERLSGQCGEEIRRLESIFSLFQEDSALRRLNREGYLENPPSELVELLQISREVSELTGGAFDVTVQPLWELYRDHFNRYPDDSAGPPEAELKEVRTLVDYREIRIEADRISFGREGMAITLNGIAQGYLTDKLTGFLEQHGVTSCLVQLGEHRALGGHPDGEPWRVAIASPDGWGDFLDVVELRDRALATSGGYGNVFDPESLFHHLFHPKGDDFQSARRTVSVEARTATWADALATAGGVMRDEQLEQLEAKLPEVVFRIYKADTD